MDRYIVPSDFINTAQTAFLHPETPLVQHAKRPGRKTCLSAKQHAPIEVDEDYQIDIDNEMRETSLWTLSRVRQKLRTVREITMLFNRRGRLLEVVLLCRGIQEGVVEGHRLWIRGDPEGTQGERVQRNRFRRRRRIYMDEVT